MKFLIKRLIDILISLFLILIFFPLWLLIALAIRLDSEGPIFYLHKRVGLLGKEFICIKFRSMHEGSDENTLVSKISDKRLTKVGDFLRKISLDETPQLVNVLLGDMSIVGPRPALPSQVKEFTKSDFDKLLVKPGLTGWTQINGRNSMPYKKRMEFDTWYAKNWNLLLDLKIILLTPFVIFKQQGIYDVK